MKVKKAIRKSKLIKAGAVLKFNEAKEAKKLQIVNLRK